MNEAAYDRIADDYAATVAQHLNDPTSVIAVATTSLLAAVGSVAGLAVCDLGCGEGHLSRHLARQAESVVGIDISVNLLNLARRQSQSANLSFVLDDAQTLSTQKNDTFDLAVSNLSLMDTPDLKATYTAVYRVLRKDGRFVFSITHPCFQAPHTDVEADSEGNFLVRRISQYAEEGFWRSTNASGIRGKVGAVHRTLSTYINELIVTGFRLDKLIEPTLSPGGYADPYVQSHVKIPLLLIVAARKLSDEG